MSTRESNAARIFLEAVEHVEPGQWHAFVDEACTSDPMLRARVNDLLLAHGQPNGLLDENRLVGSLELPQPELPGTVIGYYTLREQVGEGGFGIVYSAEQERPVRRRVALKVIKPGMDTREVIARFEAERQALAMMDHPNIARVYDAGATENGRPYFVMELVQGVPITEYCDQCNLTTRERLQLFVSVCQAVQHAHQKGVIHRDIKPTNVMVAMQDGKPAPKIIDFGVAKALNQRLTEHTLTTAFAQMVGTPLYMSPEQAELSALGADTRSDIYSLGVLLYELLTGTTPFDKERLREASYDELRRIIREEEPPRPSARISTIAADLATTIAECRRTDTRRLQQMVRGELDWIVMKCLEKDRNRRYDSAGSLARDVERYLCDEQVQACPPSTFYRLKKFIRRNRSAAAFVLLLLTAVAALTVSNIQSKRNERRAVTESAKAVATSGLLLSMLDSADPEQAKGSEYTVRELLDDFSAGLGDQLKDQPEAEAAVHLTIGNAYRRLNQYEKAKPHLETALQIRRDLFGDQHELVAESLVDLAWNHQYWIQDNEASEKLLRDALAIYQRGPTDAQPVISALWRLECVLSAAGRLDEAVAAAQQALELADDQIGTDYPETASVLHSLAQIRIKQKRYEEAEELARRSVEIHRRLHAPNHPETAFALQKLGVALYSQGKSDEAEPMLREALSIFRRHYRPDDSMIVNCLADLKRVLEARGDKAALEALANEEAEQAARSESPDHHLQLAELLISNDSQNQSDAAREMVRLAIEGNAQVAIEHPDNFDRRLKAVDGMIKVATICAASREFSGETKDVNRRLKAELAELDDNFGDSNRSQQKLGEQYRNWAFAIVQNSNYFPQAEYACRKATKDFEELLTADPDRRYYQLLCANAYFDLGDVLSKRTKLKSAADAFRRAKECYDQYGFESESESLEIIFVEARISYGLLLADDEIGARETIDEAALQANRITNPDLSANALFGIALMQLRLGNVAGYRAACASMIELPDEFSDETVRYRRIWACCLAPDAIDDPKLIVRQAEEFVASNSLDATHLDLLLLGAAHYQAGQYAEAATRLEESITKYPDDPKPGYDTINYQRLQLAMARWQLGERYEARRLWAETLPALEEELQNPSTSWNRRAATEVLRREAETLITPTEADQAVENEMPVQSPLTTND